LLVGQAVRLASHLGRVDASLHVITLAPR
jgi:hypothetical protein